MLAGLTSAFQALFENVEKIHRKKCQSKLLHMNNVSNAQITQFCVMTSFQNGFLISVHKLLTKLMIHETTEMKTWYNGYGYCYKKLTCMN